MSYIASPDLPEALLADRVYLYSGDNLDILPQLASNSFDSCVTDPPYSLGFMGKEWDSFQAGKEFQAWCEQWAKELLRVLKPGAFLLAFGGTRTYHRMVCAIEDAGFEVRDCMQWIYGNGFPKGVNISKAIDKAAGIVRERSPITEMQTGTRLGKMSKNVRCASCGKPRASADPCTCPRLEDVPVSELAQIWEGWSTTLKPACELIVMARKPLSESSIHENVLKWGTGALNIDGCRIDMSAEDIAYINERITGFNTTKSIGGVGSGFLGGGGFVDRGAYRPEKGRWPANVIHDGSPEAVADFPVDDATTWSTEAPARGRRPGGFANVGASNGNGAPNGPTYADRWSAARFFYAAKADSLDRMGSNHPTIKPLDLMQYLARLATQPGGIILDLFAGSGTTGEAAWREGFNAVLIEREPTYQDHIRTRMKMAQASPWRRKAFVAAEKVKSGRVKEADLPLFERISH